MNRILFFFSCMIFFLTAKTQNNYAEAMQMGDNEFKNKEYRKAINLYLAAQAFDQTKKDIVKEKVNKAFDMIDALKKKAEDSEKQAIQALNKAQKLTDAFYFYAGRFAIAFNNDKFYFIDMNGDEITKFGRWDRAEQFDQFELFGLAKVKSDGVDYLLDTSGSKYKVAYDIKAIDTSTRAVDLSDKQLDTFPAKILNYPQLEILIFKSFYNNPNSIRIVEFLENRDDTNSFPAKITGLRNLKYLHLANFQITSLPEQIEDLKDLVTLDLLGNKLKSLPKQIGELKNLRTLILSINQLSDLPSEIANLTNLKELYLNANEFDRFPDIIMNLKNLKKLFLNENSLDKLPAQFAESNKNLTTLGLSQIEFNSWPSPVEKMKNLTELSLFDIGLETLPDEIGDLKNLITLNLSENELTNLPGRIKELKNLRTLDLSYNKLNNLSEQIGELNNLTNLYLEGNKLSKLPREIAKLKKLKTLGLHGNKIPHAEIEKIKRLLPNCEIITE